MSTLLEPGPLAPAARFRLVEAASVTAAEPLVDEVLGARLAGFVVRAAVPGEHAARVLDRLERGTFGIPAYPSEHFRKGFTVSPRPLASSRGAEQLALYFEHAPRTLAAFSELFAGGEGYSGCVERLLGALSRRPVALARREDGSPFVPATIRRMRAGAEIGLHCELETMHFDGMRTIEPYIRPDRILSLYVGLATPETSGELRVYDMVFGQPSGEVMRRSERVGEPLEAVTAGVPYWRVRLGPGDLLVFDAGSHFHRVVQVEGDTARWTLGALAAVSRDDASLLYWG